MAGVLPRPETSPTGPWAQAGAITRSWSCRGSTAERRRRAERAQLRPRLGPALPGTRGTRGGWEGGGRCRGRPPTWPAAVTVLLWPRGRPAGVCPPGPSGPPRPRVGSRRRRLRFRSGTGAGRSRQPPSRRRRAGSPGRCSGRPRRRGNSGGGAGQRVGPHPAPGHLPPPTQCAGPHLRQPVHIARACGETLGSSAAHGARGRGTPEAFVPVT